MRQFASLTLFILLMSFSFSNYARGYYATFPFEVKISGQGSRSIIFIPGFSCSGEVWDETKSKYEKNYTCYTLTMAGFADAKAKPNATFKNWEIAIASYIIEKKIDKPILIGHSLGGCLAMAVASDYHELIDKIVIVDALPCLSALMNSNFISKKINDCSKLVKQLTTVTNEQFYQMQKTSISRLVTDTSKQRIVLNWGIQSDRTTYAEMYCDFLNTDLREEILEIKCPALILLEANFKNIKPQIEQQYKNLRTADLQYADKGLHFIMYDDKEWYFKQLNRFLN